jgi:DNA polymerase delta subunit 1
MVVFQALSWNAADQDEQEYTISVFGRTEDGKSVCVTTIFKPYFFVKVPSGYSEIQIRGLYQKIRKAVDDKIDTYELLKSKDLWGFQNNETALFMKLNFSTLADFKSCDNRLKKALSAEDSRPLKVYESAIEPLLRFMHRTGIQSTGWLDTGSNCIRSHLTTVNIDLFCKDWRTLKPVKDKDENAPFIVASFDIECYSSTGKFPDADIPEDCCFQIAFTLKRLGEKEIYKRTCLVFGPHTPDPDIVQFETEKDLLIGFKNYIREHDIDILTGWNIWGFDLEYLYKRAMVVDCLDQFNELGKIKGLATSVAYKKLSSGALGDNVLKLLPISGVFIFDLFQDVKREQKLDSYSLNSVSERFLGDQKIDMPPKEIFARFKLQDPQKLLEVAQYCIKDTVLPHQLMDKLCTLLNLLEMAKATWVPIHYLAERGQQIKVFSQLSRKARELGFMVPTIRYGAVTSDGYEGATVLEAHTGAYYVPITALDFEGLYPSIMMAHNLCYSTLVLDSKYENIPGVTYESFKIGDKVYKFAQNVPSLLPEVLAELKAFRKTAKKMMAQCSPDLKQVYNGKQLAYKISMNSVYGFTGAGKGMLPCVAIAAAVTSEGRHMIEQTKEHVEKNFPGSKVRYGDTDSVMVEFDVQGRTGEDAIEYSWKLGEQAAEMCNSLFKKPKNLELEKVYCPYFLYSKKRYAAKLWVKKGEKMHMDYIDVKGLQLVRRDNTPFVREVSKEILDVILGSNDPESAKSLAVQRAKELLDGKVPIEKLTLSQKLGDNYKSDNLAHVQVCNKIREREPGSEPQSGDRVPYVLIKGDSGKMFEKAEDPKWVKLKNIPLDYEYYFTNKFMTPICDLLEPLVKDAKVSIFQELIKPKKTRAKKPEVVTKTIDQLFGSYRHKQESS